MARRARWETSPQADRLDKKGVVRSVHLGYHDGEEKEIETELKTLL